MKHVLAAARYADIDLDDGQIGKLATYREWLRSEGHRSGGIGPAESNRLERRHLADSLLFAGFVTSSREVWDLGTGVGLPGVPLAIALPDTSFVLFDRSGRRIDLLRRVVRILDLENCETVQGEIEDLQGPVETIVTRASLSPHMMLMQAHRLLRSSGRAIMAGSWSEAPQQPGWDTVEIPEYVLDQTVWLLIMRRA